MIWNRVKQVLGSGRSGETPAEPTLEWHDPGPENPFGMRLLDCRPVTWTLVSTTVDPKIAEQFVALRHNDGTDLLGASIPDQVTIPVSVSLPHNGAALEGVVSKAPEMEVKWDIYIYDSVFLFARSWTGELRYRAHSSIGPDEIRITQIECAEEDADLAAATVYFLMGTHALGRVLPHQIPEGLERQGAEAIAAWSFSQFGRLACYATEGDVTSIPITPPDGSR